MASVVGCALQGIYILVKLVDHYILVILILNLSYGKWKSREHEEN